jgi:hypothetical protein
MSGRDDILASIRANLPRVDRPLPYVPPFDDDPPASLLDAFKASLHRMGGMFLDPPAAGDILAPVRANIAGAQIVCSMVPEITGNQDIADLGALRDLADVDFAIVRASFAVAETGSVLLSDADLRVNAVAYLAQHLSSIPPTLSSICTTPIAGLSSATGTMPVSTPAHPRRRTSKVSSSTAPRACARFLSCQSREQPGTRPIETEEESHGPDHQDSAF